MSHWDILQVFESFNKIIRYYISRTNQKNFSHDALSYFYCNFRINFISNISNRSAKNLNSFDCLLENRMESKLTNQNFSKRVFNGNNVEFCNSSKYNTNDLLVQFFNTLSNNSSIHIFERNANRNEKIIYLEFYGNYFEFQLGIVIYSIDNSALKSFLGRPMKKTVEIFHLEPNCLIVDFQDSKIVNFQHDCLGSFCNVSGTKVIHATVDRYTLNDNIFKHSIIVLVCLIFNKVLFRSFKKN